MRSAGWQWFTWKRIKWTLGILALLAAVTLVAAEACDRVAFKREAARLPALLELKPGSAVADVGAGKGKMAARMAAHVGPQGHVFATEIDAERLADIRKAAAKAGMGNVTVMEGGERDTRLPERCCEAIFLRKVYHHVTDPAPMNASLYRSLRPGGVLAIIDFSPGTFFWLWRPKGVPENRGGHGIPQKIVIEELTGAGFRLERVANDWPGWQYCVVFRKPAS